MPLAIGDHAARVAAAIDWLTDLCGDYAPLRRQFIAGYFSVITTQLEAHRVDLVEQLNQYDGLYAPEDFLWSALMPLPRGWVPVGDQLLPADVVFWDGMQPIAIEIALTHDSASVRARCCRCTRPSHRARHNGRRSKPAGELPALLARPDTSVEPVPSADPAWCHCCLTSPTNSRYSAAYCAAGLRHPTSVIIALRCSRRHRSGCRHTESTRMMTAVNISSCTGEK